jgi:hypothetical protein
MRTATLPCPPVILLWASAVFGKIKVNGPGQKKLARSIAYLGIDGLIS